MINATQRNRSASLATQHPHPSRDDGNDVDQLERAARELSLLAGAIRAGSLPLTPGRSRRIREKLEQLQRDDSRDAAPRTLLRQLDEARRTIEDLLPDARPITPSA